MAAPDTPRYLNGAWLAKRATGVERTAGCIVAAVDRALGPDDGRFTLLHPPGVTPPRLARVQARAVGPAGLPRHAWEQGVLPRAARDGLLLSLAGSAPAFAARQVATLHDAAVFDAPRAYPRAFGAWYRGLFRRLARRAEAVLTVSAFSRDALARATGVAADRFVVVPNGADHLAGIPADDAVLARLGACPGRVLLAVGSANATKNLDALVRAFATLGARDDATLAIVGGGNAQVFAGGGARERGPRGGATAHGAPPAQGSPPVDPPRVLRLGALPDAQLKALYETARALVFPSTYEGFGLPPLEAMACGCPVVAARAAALPEVCGDAALYVDPRSDASIAEAMRRVLEDDALCARLREAGLARAAAFTWDAAAARVLQVLRGLP